MNRTVKLCLSLVLAGVAAFGGTNAAYATSVKSLEPVSAAAEAAISCGQEDVDAGTCAPYVVAAGQDPMTEAVSTLVSKGKKDAAKKFLANVSEARGANPSEGSSGLEASGSQASTPASSSGSKYHDGMLSNPNEWDLYTPLTYGYCTTGGCNAVGTTRFDLWYTLYDYGTPGYGVGLSGTTFVEAGNSLIQTKYTCKTFYEVWPADQDIHDWSTCPNTVGPNPFMVKMIPWEGWDQGSAQGTTYHLEVTVGFKVLGDTNGAEFSYLFNSFIQDHDGVYGRVHLLRSRF